MARYTRSAVSQQLSALEAEAGALLVDRTGNHITLTPAGAREQQLNQPVEQGLLAVHVAVEHHRRHAELLRDRVHGHGLNAALVGGTYRRSAEELAPARWADAGADPVTALPVAAAALAALIHPAAWRHFAAGATSAYSLTPAAWRRLLDTAAAGHLNAAR